MRKSVAVEAAPLVGEKATGSLMVRRAVRGKFYRSLIFLVPFALVGNVNAGISCSLVGHVDVLGPDGEVIASDPTYSCTQTVDTPSSGPIVTAPGSSGGDVSDWVQPIDARLNCVLGHYPVPGERIDPNYSTVTVSEYGWVNKTDPDDVKTTTDNVAPAGYERTDGFTDPFATPPTTYLFAGSLEPPTDYEVKYIDPDHPNDDPIKIVLNLGPIRWQVFVAAHELAHQHGLGSSYGYTDSSGNPDVERNEHLADGYGIKALEEYNSDSGSFCNGK